MKATYVLLVALAGINLIAGAARAQIIAADNYNYANGNLDGDDGGAGWSGAWNGHTYGTPTVAGDQAIINALGTDAHRSLASAQGAGTVAWLRFTAQQSTTASSGITNNTFGGLDIFHGGTEVGLIGKAWPGPYRWTLVAGGSSQISTQSTLSASVLYACITTSATNTMTINLWINPANPSSLATVKPDATQTFAGSGWDTIYLRADAGVSVTESWAFGSLAVGATLADVAAPAPGSYEVINANSGMVMEVGGWATTNGAAVDQWIGDTGANQQWTLASLGGGNYTLVNNHSGLALQVGSQSTTNGAPVDQWSYSAGSNQQWKIAPLGSGCFEIINLKSQLALEVEDGALTDGATFDQWSYDGGANQQWLFAPVSTTDTLLPVSGGPGVAAATFHGFNWAVPNGNACDGPLLLTDMSLANSYTNNENLAEIVLSAFASVGGNSIRIPINPATVNGSWWTSYKGVIDQATGMGIKVIICPWCGASDNIGVVNDLPAFFKMWDTVIMNYNSNPDVYFEIHNEPYGYATTGDWMGVVTNWLNRYPTVAHGRVLVGGTGADGNVPAVAAYSAVQGCLFSVHDYGYWNQYETNDAYWYGNLSNEVGSHASATILTEFGASMTYDWNYAGGDQNSDGIAGMIGFCNYCCSNNMGSMLWEGLCAEDSYSMFTLNTNPLSMSLNCPSGMDLVDYGWSAFNGTGTYRLLNGNSGLALEVGGWAITNGAPVDQWSYDGGANQKWTLSGLGNGYYEIINNNSWLALEVGGTATTDGAPVIQSAYTGGLNQQWELLYSGAGFYEIINRNSGLALEVGGWAMTDGALVDQWSYDGGANQVWTFGPK